MAGAAQFLGTAHLASMQFGIPHADQVRLGDGLAAAASHGPFVTTGCDGHPDWREAAVTKVSPRLRRQHPSGRSADQRQ
jgi:hypothetical protein